MSQSALQLERYFFAKVDIETMRHYTPGLQSEIQTKLNAGQNNDEPNRYLLELTVTVSESQGQLPPYTVEVIVMGFFKVNEQKSQEEQKQLVAVTGASILYGVAREMITNVTARGPWPPITLPCMNFNAAPGREERHTPRREVTPAKNTRR